MKINFNSLKKRALLSFAVILALFATVTLSAQKASSSNRGDRRQVPGFFQRSYFEIGVGYINYNFSQEQLQPGFQLEKVQVPHTSIRLVLLGHQIHPNLHAQITYMRPVDWVRYHYSWDNDGVPTISDKTVWMNVAGLTLKPQVELFPKLWLNGEVGLGIVTRNGIEEEDIVVVEDLTFPTVNSGLGLYYQLNNSFGLTANYSYSMAVKGNDQPPTHFAGGGFRYNFAPFSEEKLERAEKRGSIYPKQWFSFAVSSNIAGYGVNNFFRRYYIFWGGAVETKFGIMASYHRNIFNAPKVFSLDVGANIAYWTTRENEEPLFAASIFPVFRFNLARTKKVDPYFFYVLGGPTYLSSYILDGIETGKHFTFYDAMGLGLFCGAKREYNIELKIAHYSNGNLFPINRGVKIPLTLSFGYAF